MSSTGSPPTSLGKADWRHRRLTFFNQFAGLLKQRMSAKRKHIANSQMIDALQCDITQVNRLPLTGNQSRLALEFC
jgi:hypothetical protein